VRTANGASVNMACAHNHAIQAACGATRARGQHSSPSAARGGDGGGHSGPLDSFTDSGEKRKMRQWLTVVPSHLAPHGAALLACSRRRRGSTRPQTVARRLESRHKCHHSSKTQQRPRLICAASSRSLIVQSSQKRPSPCPTPKLAHWCHPRPSLCTTEQDEEK
jgi:hypothetical protein